MQYFLEGLGFGLILTISMGPIFVALVQTSIEKGLKPGITVGVGIWSSDFLIIGATLYLVSLVKELVASETFNLYMGIAGGIVMVLFGFYMLWHKASVSFEGKTYSAKNYFGFWMKGFLVNTLNPFTYIFWLGVIATQVFGRGVSLPNTIIFLGTIMFVIISSDLLKIAAANYIRKGLKLSHIDKATNIAGVFLIIFGIALIYNAFWPQVQ